MQHRIDPVRRLLATFILTGRPGGRRVRALSLKAAVRGDNLVEARSHPVRRAILPPVSRGRRIGCSVRFSVPGVMDRLKGRQGPTIFLAKKPKKS